MSKPKSTKTLFSPYECRVLNLGFGTTAGDSPEGRALRKIIDAFPFVLEVAEHHFDPRISKQILMREADKIIKEQQLEQLSQAGT